MSLVKKGQQPVEDQLRDKTFAAMRHINQNNICIDCEKKNPKWASIYLGVHLCIDCAGKHRQYGVIYSFVKSTNLDKWNHKQILFMQKGSNSRALQYFRKCGVITQKNRHIDYKSPVVQKYKNILTQQVQIQLNGKPIQKPQSNNKIPSQKSISLKQHTNNLLNQSQQQQQVKQIPHAQIVYIQNKQKQGKKKKDKKKKMGNQINIQDFQSMTFDDGVSKQQKQKIVKSYQTAVDKVEVKGQKNNDNNDQHDHGNTVVEQIKPQPKQLSEEQVKKKMQQLKQQKNVKSISSQQFKDQSYDNVQIKQKFNQFAGSTSISSSSFNNQTEQSNATGQTIQKIKDLVSNVSVSGGKLYQKLSSYWSK